MLVPVRVYVSESGFNWVWLDEKQEELYDGTDTAEAVLDAIWEKVDNGLDVGKHVFSVKV